VSAAAIRVAGNDDRLAHGLARRAVDLYRQRSLTSLHEVLKATTLKSFTSRVTNLYAGRIVDCARSERLTGSRTHARAAVLESTISGDLRVIILKFDGRQQRNKVSHYLTDMLVKRHVLARVMQRTTGNGSAELSTWVLNAHLAALPQQGRPPVGAEFRLMGHGGLIAGAEEDGYIVVKTWIDAASISDLRTRAVAAAAEWTMETSS
jgi:hypothetical protein